jgi:competence protein ComEC
MDGMSVLMLYAALGLLAVWIKIREDARTEKLAVTKKSRIFAR